MTDPAPVADAIAPAQPEMPLRLRRRRDGSLALTDRLGAITSPEREFPPERVFLFGWLISTDGARSVQLDGDVLTLTLCNGRAVYRVVETLADQQGIRAVLELSELYDAVPVDEAEAERRGAGAGPIPTAEEA